MNTAVGRSASMYSASFDGGGASATATGPTMLHGLSIVTLSSGYFHRKMLARFSSSTESTSLNRKLRSRRLGALPVLKT